ncbi:hypothetical protein E2562_017659 [Oryza meyeriana var. granulata]|uniref:TCP domain-containing protein n=1 Tax=Oryza meyeriana var. granulata TaxID=110450 RepID=A0A6G1BZ70_9ORYZ|nr:hypothetical protein E2562_017659 [Oryza meyeriana var. granulata]
MPFFSGLLRRRLDVLASPLAFQQQPYPLLASAASGDDVEDGAAASALRQASHTPFSPKKPPPIPVYKDLDFNRDLSATKKLQAGVNLVARLVGVTLGPKGRNVVLSNKYGPPKIVNDGETVLKEIELEDPSEYLGVKLVRKAGARMNDVTGDGCSTSIILAQGLITEGMKVLAAGINPVQIAQGIEKTASALVSELRLMSQELCFFLTSLSSVSAGDDYAVGNMISDAFKRVGRKRMNSSEWYHKKILGERIARLCGGIAIIQILKLQYKNKLQVGAQTVIEMNDKKLRIEDALNATRSAVLCTASALRQFMPLQVENSDDNRRGTPADVTNLTVAEVRRKRARERYASLSVEQREAKLQKNREKDDVDEGRELQQFSANIKLDQITVMAFIVN